MGKEIAKNKKAFHDYELLDRLEVGIELVGSEVKSIRAAKVQLKESYIRFVKNQAVVFGMHIGRLSTTQADFAPDEKRARTLLLHRKEIDKWERRVKLEGLTVVPLRIYFNNKNYCKMDIGLAKGRKNYDKRELIKEREANKNAKRAMKIALSDL